MFAQARTTITLMDSHKSCVVLQLYWKYTIYFYYCSRLLPPLNLEFSLDYGYDHHIFKSKNQDTCSNRKYVYPNMLSHNSVFVSKWPFSESLKLVWILMHIWVLHWHSWCYMAMEQLEGIFKAKIALDCRWGGAKELSRHYDYGKQKIRKAWMCGEVRMIIMRALQKTCCCFSISDRWQKYQSE